MRPRVVGSDALPFDDKPRIYPIDLDATGRWRDSFDIALPPGYVVDETPDPVDVDMDFASYHSTVTAKGNLLHYEREYVVRQVEIPADKAADFRRLESPFSPTKRAPPSSKSSNRSKGLERVPLQDQNPAGWEKGDGRWAFVDSHPCGGRSPKDGTPPN